MADAMKFNQLLVFLLLLFLHKISTSMADEELSLRDLNAAIFTLRSNGYNLFANSIAVSDLSFQMLSVSSFNSTTVNGGGGDSHGGDSHGHGFTLLAPPNSALFSLDMSTDAFTYVHSLRFHVIPRRLSFSDLRNISLSSDPYLETLALSHAIAVASSGDVVSVDGVLITFPDMHLQSRIAVHGLDGILLSSALRVEDLGFATAPQPFAGAFSPQIAEVPSPDVAFSPEIGAPSPSGSFTLGSGFGSVSIPPTGFFSSDIAETPTPTPSPSPACAEWPNCEFEFLSPYIWPPTASLPPSANIPLKSSIISPISSIIPPQSSVISPISSIPPPISSIIPPISSTIPPTSSTIPPTSSTQFTTPPPSPPSVRTIFAPPVRDTAREWWQSGQQATEKNDRKTKTKNKHHHTHHHHHHHESGDENHNHHYYQEYEDGEEEAEYIKKREEGNHGYGLGWRVEETQNHDYDHLNFAKYNQDNTLPPPQNWW